MFSMKIHTLHVYQLEMKLFLLEMFSKMFSWQKFIFRNTVLGTFIGKIFERRERYYSSRWWCVWYIALPETTTSFRRSMSYCSACVQRHHRIIRILSAVTFFINLLLFSYLAVSSALVVYDNDGGDITQMPVSSELSAGSSTIRRSKGFTANKRQTNLYKSHSTNDLLNAHGGRILDENVSLIILPLMQRKRFWRRKLMMT